MKRLERISNELHLHNMVDEVEDYLRGGMDPLVGHDTYWEIWETMTSKLVQPDFYHTIEELL